MKSASRPTLRRLLTLDQKIRAGGFPNATTLARELEVHARTIHRDIDFLRNSWGAPLEFCTRRNGYFYSKPDYALPLLHLSEGELVALFLAERLLQEYAGTPQAALLASLFAKVTSALPDEVTVDLSHLGQSYSFRHLRPSESDTKLFEKLTHAVQLCRQLELRYWTASRDEVSRRLVDPYHLTSVQGDWYLVAYCHLREEVRMFAPGRIRALKETARTFERPADFRIEDYLDHSFRAFRGDGQPYRVRLKFSAEISRYIREKQWHPSQKLQPQKDGSLLVTLQVSHLLEVKRWSMSYGPDCEVLEPAELRQEIQRDLERMKAMYP